MSNQYTCVMYVSYRVNDSSEGLEASPHRKHMLHSVCNGCKLQKHTEKEFIVLGFFFDVFEKYSRSL